MDDLLAFGHALGAKHALHKRRASIHIGVALFGDGLRGRLIAGLLQAGQELPLGLYAAINVDGNKGIGEQQVERLGVVVFEGAVSGIVECEDVGPFIRLTGALRHGGPHQAKGEEEKEDRFHVRDIFPEIRSPHKEKPRPFRNRNKGSGTWLETKCETRKSPTRKSGAFMELSVPDQGTLAKQV